MIFHVDPRSLALLLTGSLAMIPIIKAVLDIWNFASPRFASWINRRTLRERLGAEVYDPHDIQRATTFYIEPDFQSLDPGGQEEFRRVVAAREPLFATTDRILESTAQYRFTLVLGDSGTGKTSFVLNYYAYHWRRAKRRKRFDLVLVPLSSIRADDLISNVPEADRRDTVLLLDSLDEDPRAISDYKQRVSQLIALTSSFRAVIITCRSQFFPRDEEIPTETGVFRIGSIAPGEPRVYYFHKLYLAPLTDDQVDKYLKRRFSIRRLWYRRRAREVVRAVPDLMVRPMLLAHVEDLVIRKRHERFAYRHQIYAALIDAWLERERGFIKDVSLLREFSELLAVDLFLNREQRQAERIPGPELEPLAQRYGISLQDWQLRTRSLLNRDAEGNYKFAHRSFMEYLVVIRFVNGNLPQGKTVWTDQMRAFLVEMILNRQQQGNMQSLLLRGADLRESKLVSTVLDKIDLSCVDLTGSSLTRSSLRYATLTTMVLCHVDMRKVDLSYADLRESDLSFADLGDATLEFTRLDGANLKETALRGATLRAVSFEGVKFEEARCQGVRFHEMVLRGTSLRGIDLSEAAVCDCEFDDVDCEGASFRNCVFRNTTFRGGSLARADLVGATWDEKSSLIDVDCRGVIGDLSNLPHARSRGVNLGAANLVSYKLAGSKWVSYKLRNASLSYLDLREADFTDADLSEADLTGAKLRGASLRRAVLCRARFVLADVTDVDFTGADVRGAILDLVNGLTSEQMAACVGDSTTRIGPDICVPEHWRGGGGRTDT